MVSTPVQVVAVGRLTDRFTRVVVGGDGLGSYHPLPGDAFRLLIPPAGEERPVMASYGDDGFPYWPEGVPRPTLRTYSARAADPVTATLTFDVLRPGPGIGAHWLDRTRIGSHLHVVGMRHGFVLPADAAHLVLVAEASALGQAAAILDHLPAAVEATVLAEAPTDAEHALLPERERTTIRWMTATTSTGGGSPLELMVRALPALAAGTLFRVTAEAGVTRAIRRHLLDERGVDVGELQVIVHWKAGRTADERDEELLPRYRQANGAGLDLRDLDVLDALDLELPLPAATPAVAAPALATAPEGTHRS